MSKVPNMPSEVSILKSKAAAKTGPGAHSLADTETVWPKAEFVRFSYISACGYRSDRFCHPFSPIQKTV